MGKLAQMAQGQSLERANPSGDIQTLLKNNWGQIKALVPKHMTSERMFQTLVVAINNTPELVEVATAAPETLLSCFIKCTALGLEPSSVDNLGRAYILPFRNHGRMEAQFIIGYKGYIDLARRSGEIKSIHAQAVYVGDEFDCWEDETGQHFKYRPSRDNQRVPDNLTDVYVCAHLKDGGFVFERMTKAEVDAIRARSKASQNGPWKTDYEAMALKTVIRRSARYLPLTAQAQEAVAMDETTPDYSGIFSPVIKPEDAQASTQALPQQPKPTDEEKAELRRLTDSLVQQGCDKGVANWIWEQYQRGGIEAAKAGYEATMESIRKSRESQGVDPETGEVLDGEIELADEDIQFGEE